MKYVVLLIADGEVPAWSELAPEEQGELMGRFEAFDAACRDREGVEILAGEALGGPESVKRRDPERALRVGTRQHGGSQERDIVPGPRGRPSGAEGVVCGSPSDA